MKVRVTRASAYRDYENAPCSGAVLKTTTYYDTRNVTLEELKQDTWYYNNCWKREGINHREWYDKYNKPHCTRDLTTHVWVMTIPSLKALTNLIEEVGKIIIEPESSYKGISYHVTIYDDYIE